jgi:hypothetical protein
MTTQSVQFAEHCNTEDEVNPLTASHFFIEFIICIAYFQEAIA